VATEAFFNVTLPEPTWSAKDVEEHMAGFNRGTIISTPFMRSTRALHAVPMGALCGIEGAQAAGLRLQREGWAHYSEQMMLDQATGARPGLHHGKLEIMKLREDYKKKMGSRFSLEEFHNISERGISAGEVHPAGIDRDDSPAL